MWFEEGWTNTFSHYSRIMIPETPRHARNQRPVAPSHLGVHLCAEALGFFFQLQHSLLRWRVASVRLGLIQSSDAQMSGLLTPSMWCLNKKHVMGWDEAPRPIRLKTCCDSSPFCTYHECTECVKKIPTSLKGERPRWVWVYILGRCAFSWNLENWCLPVCNLRWSPWILEGRPQCQLTLLPKCILMFFEDAISLDEPVKKM